MTTTPAMPDLTAVIKWLENGCDPREAVKELKHYQSKLQAIATLQSQPAAAGVSDAEAKYVEQIMEQAQVFASAWSLVGGRFDFGNALDDANEAKDELRALVARAILALRPQAVPMTDDLANEFAREMVKGGRSVEWLVRKVESHHGITAPAGGEKQA